MTNLSFVVSRCETEQIVGSLLTLYAVGEPEKIVNESVPPTLPLVVSVLNVNGIEAELLSLLHSENAIGILRF